MIHPTPPPANDPLDRDYLERNYLALGCADVLADVAALYLESSVEKLAGIQNALAAGDTDQLAKLAHGLKGESGSVAARNLTALAAELEQHARRGDLEACRRCLPQAEEELQRVIAVLRQEFCT